MSNGQPTPKAHDGMAAFRLPNGNVRLIRNHEDRELASRAKPIGNPARAYDAKGGGGTTSLEIRLRPDGTPELVHDFVSLSGTIVNCAGGPTPWGTWLSCEETTEGTTHGWSKQHGYVFEVSARAEAEVEPVPLRAMGRFIHEAVAVDPGSGIVYLTEDDTVAGLYRFLPRRRGQLAAGGRLQMLAVSGRPKYTTSADQKIGERLRVTWVDIEDPDPAAAEHNVMAVYEQGFERGAAWFSRLEGCFFGNGRLYFHSTDGGDAGLGQVWEYLPGVGAGGELRLIFESPAAGLLYAPDNVTVSPRGGVLICEDNNEACHLRGLTRDGKIFDFARNIVNNGEFAGATFSPDGRILFVNVQGDLSVEERSSHAPRLSKTFAIWGPWSRGAL
jgi:secreted PhoX family phosphatase